MPGPCHTQSTKAGEDQCIKRKHPLRSKTLPCQSWGSEQLFFKKKHSGEDQVGFSDKPVIAYLVGRPAALTSGGGSWLTAISGAGT